MLLRRVPFLLVLSVLLNGCGSSRDVVAHGLLQKRKYRPGWHVDLPHRDNTLNALRAVRHIREATSVQPRRITPSCAPIARSIITASILEPRSSPLAMTRHEPMSRSISIAPMQWMYPRQVTPWPGKDHYLSERPFSWLAVISLIAAIELPLVGIINVDNKMAIAGAIIGFLFGLVAARRCRDKGRSGEGFAIAAMIISVVVIVLSVIGLAL
jgi:hypothetical protein